MNISILTLSVSAFIFALLPANLNGQNIIQDSRASDNWKKISVYFKPTRAYKNVYGDYRSPLKFYNGRKVKSALDWSNRRNEILGAWHRMMGAWPPFIKDQQLEILDSTHYNGYMQFRIKFWWLPNQQTEGYLLIPDQPGKKPAVITVYYEPETAVGLGKPDLTNRDFALQLAKRGFVTLSIGTTETTNAKTYSLYYPDVNNSRVEPLSVLAYAAANAWYALAKLPQVDSSKIGIMGHSYGGKWAMFASCLFDKFACAVWSDPGVVFDSTRADVNYWEPWYLGYTKPPWRKRGLITQQNPAAGLYPKLVAQGYDLHELHALMAPRPFLVSGGAEDGENRWIPLNHSIAVNRLLGFKNRVAMTNRATHAPTTESNEQAYTFLEYFLKPESQ